MTALAKDECLRPIGHTFVIMRGVEKKQAQDMHLFISAYPLWKCIYCPKIVQAT